MGDVQYSHALLAGAVAGMSVDMILFPLDTIKTRLQSAKGFLASGGMRGIYSGIASAATGSMPTAAAFFCTYELVKSMSGDNYMGPAVGAALGEVAACTIRVPTEVVKQRAQATRQPSAQLFLHTLRQEGLSGFYRGFWSTVIREVPFSFIQFPLWEALKKRVAKDGVVTPRQSAVCGAASGMFAAGLTNPLDVAKTRIMLADSGSSLARGNIVQALKVVVHDRGFSGLTAGIFPRMAWMSLGGFIFLGTYDFVQQKLNSEQDI